MSPIHQTGYMMANGSKTKIPCFCVWCKLPVSTVAQQTHPDVQLRKPLDDTGLRLTQSLRRNEHISDQQLLHSASVARRATAGRLPRAWVAHRFNQKWAFRGSEWD